VVKSSKVEKFSVNRRIEWSFNPPQASHFGGVYERMIRTIRRVLEAVLRTQCLTHPSLCTLMCEVELAVNSRPLSAVTSDTGSLDIITPNKLLTLRDAPATPITMDDEESYSRRRWRQIQHLAEQFWRKWAREYRAGLQERRKWQTESRNVAVNDIVMVVDSTEARCHWPLGKVTRVFEGCDGLVRTVEALVRGKIVKRPISKLVVLLEDQDLD